MTDYAITTPDYWSINLSCHDAELCVTWEELLECWVLYVNPVINLSALVSVCNDVMFENCDMKNIHYSDMTM